MLSDCPKCWETPCVCGHEYKGWKEDKIENQIKMLEMVRNEKKTKDKK